MTDWYLVTKREVKRAGGREVFDQYRSMGEALKATFPEFTWDTTRFPTPPGYWRMPTHQRQVLERIGKDLGVKEVSAFCLKKKHNWFVLKLSDWYRISRKQVSVRGGERLFRYFPSLDSALRAVYPSYPWETWKFVEGDQAPRGFWKQKDNLLKAVDWVEKKMGLTKVKVLLITLWRLIVSTLL